MSDNYSIAYSMRQEMGSLAATEHIQGHFPAMFSSMFTVLTLTEQRYAQKNKDDKFV